MSLKEYHRKRQFDQTNEPVGKSSMRDQPKNLFVVQKHDASHLHYDFRLEMAGVLKSWAVPKGPSLDPKIKHLAMQVEDHPIDYVNFEGIIPKGQYGGGTVMVWDIGKWESLDKNAKQAYHAGNMTFILYGKKLQGKWKLIKLKAQEKNDKKPWLLFKITDEFSADENSYDVKEKQPLSAITSRKMEEIAKDQQHIWTQEGEIDLSNVAGAFKTEMPNHISPQLATLVTNPPSGNEWLHEIKWDGYRLITRISKGEVSLFTRRHHDWTAKFVALVKALESLQFNNIILDGEIVALSEDNKSNFQLLQNSLEEESSITDNFVYYIFDILYYDGYSLEKVPLIDRKKILSKLLNQNNLPSSIKYNDHVIGNGAEVFKQACNYGLEGIIAKYATSLYTQKRTKQWLKVKCIQSQEFIIGGYTDPKSSRKYFGALLLGYYDKNKKLIYCGRVGTGFSQLSLKEVSEKLTKYEQNSSSFDHFPERVSKSIHWVKPKLVAEIEFLEMTKEGLLRHPSFKGLRSDKSASIVGLESAKQTKLNTQVVLTHLDRVLYPEQGLTKQDLMDYYQSVADLILPHIKHRPLTLVRCPSGNHKNCFYQKHFNDKLPVGIKQVDIIEQEKTQPYIYIDNINGLMGLVQMGVLEIHPWGSKIKSVEKPDRLIFDLDPAPEVQWQAVVNCAYEIRQFLELLGLESFVKTTGGKGIHVVVPIRPLLDWQYIRAFTKKIAEIMVEVNPDKYIATMSKAKRKGKIFIDYVRNTRGATAIAAYSTRVKADATVSIPITWEELSSGIRPNEFNISNISSRLTELIDPWPHFFTIKQKITKQMQRKIGLN